MSSVRSSPASRAVLPVLLGALLLRLVMAGTYRKYVRTGMRPWLILAALGLLALGAWALADRGDTAADDVEGGSASGDGGTTTITDVDEHLHRAGALHDHGREVPTVAWLLLLPALALFLVAPRGLGAFAVDRSAAVPPRPSSSAHVAVLDPANGPYPMTVSEFVDRAWDGDGASIAGATVRLTGFVAPAKDGDGFLLVRFHISCCAADAVPAGVRIRGWSGPPPATDGWMTADVVFVRGEPQAIYPSARIVGSRPIAQPGQPYEAVTNYG